MKSKLLVIALSCCICVLFVLAPIQLACSQTSQTTVSVVPSQNAANVGDTFTVNVTINNVENLFGLDVTVNWNSSALLLVSSSNFLGVETNPTGVLHETTTYPIEIVDDTVSQSEGQYHLVATSEGDATAFNGSGTIATLTFNVTSAGQSTINVVSELADHPAPGETTSEFIDHTDVDSSVDAVVIPEFSQMAVVAVLFVVVSVVVLASRRFLKKNRS